MHNRAADRSISDLLHAIMCRDSHLIEATVEQFQFRGRANSHPDAARGTMLNVNRNPDGDLALFAVRLQGMETGSLHQANHVGRGIDWRQLWVMSGERVFEFDGFFRFTTLLIRCSNLFS